MVKIEKRIDDLVLGVGESNGLMVEIGPP